jgi:chromosome partitioning protein
VYMGDRLTIAMQKGGVGKSITTVNVAGALADRGHDVLAVDADPQGGLTVKLGFRERYRQAEQSLYDVLSDQGDMEFEDLAELIVPHEEFDVIPAQLRNFNLEKALYTEAGGHNALKRSLDRMDAEYDYVLIDSPPNLGPLSDGALLAARNVVFPSHPNEISQNSIWLLRQEIQTLEKKFDIEIASIGAVLNEVPPNESISNEMRDWFIEVFGEANVFEVPDRAVIEHAISYKTSVFGYDPEDAGYPWDTDATQDMCDTYNLLAQHVEANL